MWQTSLDQIIMTVKQDYTELHSELIPGLIHGMGLIYVKIAN